MLGDGRGWHLVLAGQGVAEGSPLLGQDSHSADNLAGKTGAETMTGQRSLTHLLLLKLNAMSGA